ncbi:putative wall-associated receptor kinase-like 16 [Vitis vinifera]|uniref:putative wall-associated receptor kinase-like 16 n=1 Tax=Vitis vinifera TaxID=29760 RepID=UPI000198540D|nr:putative wall-associated receptor kinase-like 16 [Vitis vinifera]
MGDQGVVLLQVTVIWVVLAAMAAPAAAQSKPGCPDRCGNVSIPYPFGTREGCYLNEEFLITCDNSTSPPKAFLTNSNINVTNINFDGELHVLSLMARNCYYPNGTEQPNSTTASFSLSIFSISDTLNKFFAVGCDTYALLQGYQGGDLYTTGCMSICSSEKQVQDGSCSGAGCCQVSFPEGLDDTTLTLSSYFNHTKVHDFNPCSYAFIAEESAFNFSSKNLTNLQDMEKLPRVVDWSIGNETCQVAKTNPSSYACKENSTCSEPSGRSGYLCKCFDGYHGNPYLDGCQDIDECENSSLNKCVEKARCKNIPGNYTCSCRKGYHGDGREDGDGCNPNMLQVIQIALGVSIGLISLLMGSSWLYWGLKKRKFIKLKKKFFEQNGGLMLRQQLSSQEGSNETVKIFSAEELEKATDKYAENKIIGQGGYGTVYKGTLTNGRIVAIKKSKMVDKSQIEQFINEVLVLSQINHRNVVKLLGCCLETEVPLLVYEFITNGTLFDYIHKGKKISTSSWEVRLRIATETAEVLSYLHSAASTPIIHRDVKSTNILLDDNYTAKVSDFGASRLVPLDQTQLSTMVQGTLGYLDPEYLLTSQLTEKSDVYSFGVVLVELLTAKKALSFDKPEEERSLAMYFLSSLKDDRLFQVLDERIVNEENIEQLKETANLAKKCLKLKGDERPTMKEVAMKLERMRMVEMHPWTDPEENEYLLGESSHTVDNGCSIGSTNTAYDSLKGHIMLPVKDGR